MLPFLHPLAFHWGNCSRPVACVGDNLVVVEQFDHLLVRHSLFRLATGEG